MAAINKLITGGAHCEGRLSQIKVPNLQSCELGTPMNE